MSRFYRRLTAMLLFSFLALCLTTLAAGATPPNDPPPTAATTTADDGRAPSIRLLADTFAPASGETASIAGIGDVGAADAARTGDGRLRYLVQFDGPILPEWRAALESAGAEIRDYIPDFAYEVAVTDEDVDTLGALPGVIWIGPFVNAYGVSPSVATVESAATQAARAELDAPPDDEFLANLETLGLELIGVEGTSLAVQGDAAALARLSSRPGVRWIAPLEMPRPANDVARGLINAPGAWSAGYAGQGQIIDVADTGVDTGVDEAGTADMHVDLNDRGQEIASWPISSLWSAYYSNAGADDGAADLNTGHGTHVTGSAVGNGAASGGLRSGVAPQADWTVQALEQWGVASAYGLERGVTSGYALLGVPADLNDLYQQAYDWGARVSTNSWVYANSGGAYTESARQIDQFIWEHRDMVVLFCAGNDGTDANSDGLVDAGSIAPPATAKNIIAVGATETSRPSYTPPVGLRSYGQFYSDRFAANPLRDDAMGNAGLNGLTAFSGRGPTQDGRLGPLVVAPGTFVISTRSSQTSQAGWGAVDANYMYDGGTSMSTPLVAGAAALVRQSYIDHDHTPSAALVKATLVQSATDITGQYSAPYNEAGSIPNNNEGWGAVNLASATAGDRRYVDETRDLLTGEAATFSFSSNGSGAARFTLVWSDYPASVAAGVQLVNDLDLEVVTPGGMTYCGNVFSGGYSATGGSADRRNTVECIYLPTSEAGGYTVRVRGYNVPQGPQPFALLVDVTPADYSRQIYLPIVTEYAWGPPVAGEFRDDFSVNNGAWPTASGGDYDAAYLNGQYRLQVAASRNSLAALPSCVRTGDLLLDVTAHSGSDVSQAYGLAFNRQDSGSYIAFLVSPSGYFSVARQDGTFITSGWVASSAIKTGRADNRLRIERVGQRVTFYINQTAVWALTSAEFTGGDRFGVTSWCLAGSGSSEAWFDNFRMAPITATTSTAAETAAVSEMMAPILDIGEGGADLAAP